MKMKKYLLLIFSLSFLTACEDYVDINKSTTGVTDGDLEAGGLIYGTQLMDMQQRVIPIGSPSKKTEPGNDLAGKGGLSSRQDIGFFGMNNNWRVGQGATWDFSGHRNNYA